MPCYYVIVNYLYVGCMFIVAKVIETISYGIENAGNPGKSCIYRQALLSDNNLRSSLIYTENGNGITGIKITACRSPDLCGRQQLCLSWRLTSCIKDGRLRRRATGSASGSSSRYSAGEQHFAEVWSSVSRSYPCSRICRSCGKYPCLLLCSVAMGFLFFLRGRDAAGKEFQGISQKTRAGVGGDCRDHSGVCIPV